MTLGGKKHIISSDNKIFVIYKNIYYDLEITSWLLHKEIRDLNCFFVVVFCRNTEAAQAAAQAAARINQQLGVSSQNNSMMQQQSDQMNLGMVITEEYKVPDRMVGLSKFSFCYVPL